MTTDIALECAEPFTLTSGKKSPVYTDCRRLISYPTERSRLMDLGANILRQHGSKIDAVAGGETAGIPYAAFLAERLNIPMLYVRKKPKGFGRMAQIEGHLQDGQHVVLIEDLQTDGGSKKVFIDALRDAGAIVEHAFVVFHYGIFPQSEVNMRDWGVKLHALTTWHEVLKVAEEKNYFNKETLAQVKQFLDNPTQWQENYAA